MLRPSARLAGFVLLFVVLTGDALQAQSRTTSAIRGTVVQADGSPVAFASVTILQTQTGAERETATTPEGRFLLQLLQPGGPYVLRIEALGFADIVRENIGLQVGETLTFEFVANEVAIDIEGIEVNAARAEIFTPDQVGPATRLDERTVEAVPILSRNIMELAVLSPLVKTTEGGGFSIAGQNDRYNSILIDGLLNKDLFGLTAGGVPGAQAGAKLIPLDAVSQYEVLVAPFDVRLSGFTGGVLNAITKTGTNEWHGRFFAVNRAEALIGDLNLPTGPVEASGVERNLFGASLGGPILRDRLHFFVSGEFEERNQPPVGFNLGRDDPLLVRISEDRIDDVDALFDQRFGVGVGDAGPYSLGLQLANIFARIDWNFGNGSRLTLRNIFANAVNDESPNRAAFEPYELSSNAVFREATNNTTTVQVFSPVGDRASNEFNLSVQYTADATAPAVDWPQVEVDVVSPIDGSAYQRPLRVGSQFFAQDNDLSQTTVRFTNSLNWSPALSNYTFGITGAFHDIDHRYLPGSRGDYFYASYNDLLDNAPQRYQRTILQPGEDPAVGIRVTEWGAFVQNQIDSGKGLTMHFGLRADVPFVLDSPARNDAVLSEFGHDTSNVPSGQILLSPRWGFNWQSDGERTTQVRGGAGMFVGQLPYVWLSNAFHNNGLRSVTAVCTGRLTEDPP
ncbi:MAG: carboxypeptidase regulatory-like domain-containing protein, partial [Gemmatimonadetes bacterium]|nr:carboxypeptidase regulatory-like domain-containing protein [Gemmatimonadota bacterium]